MLKAMKPGRRYFIINIDEPYAEKIFEILKQGQIDKGEWLEGDISFEEWKKQTFGVVYEDELPEMTDEEYDAWHKTSWVQDGVRMGLDPAPRSAMNNTDKVWLRVRHIVSPETIIDIGKDRIDRYAKSEIAHRAVEHIIFDRKDLIKVAERQTSRPGLFGRYLEYSLDAYILTAEQLDQLVEQLAQEKLASPIGSKFVR